MFALKYLIACALVPLASWNGAWANSRSTAGASPVSASASAPGALPISGSVDRAFTTGERRPSKTVRIPVFFVTDRNQLEQKRDKTKVEFGNERQYIGMDRDDPHLGLAYCLIENTEHKSKTEKWDQLGWTESTRSEEGPDGAILTSGQKYADVQSKFYDSVYTKGIEGKEHEVDIFVPGYMSTFDSGLRSAARLAYYAERPMVLYSWCSKGEFTQYISDLANVDWSQEHFNEMIRRLNEQGDKDPWLKLRLYAHSMGNKIVLRSVPQLVACKNLVEVSLVCPDVDNGVVYQYARRFFNSKSQLIVRLYESKHDRMLKLSQFAHGGYKRLGEDRKPLDAMLPAGTPMDLPDDGIGDIAGAAEREAKYKLLRRVQTFDFSDVDIGALGHRIPVEVLASVSATGQPGPGLELVLRRDTADSETSITGQPAVNGPNDGVLKVMRIKRPLPLLGSIARNRPRMRLLRTKDWSLR